MRNSADPVCTLEAWFGSTPTPNPGGQARRNRNRHQPASYHFVWKRQTSEENMTANRTQSAAFDQQLILELGIDASGK